LTEGLVGASKFDILSEFFSAISWREQVNFQWDDDKVHFVFDQHA